MPRRNDRGNELTGMCIERESLVGNTWFKKGVNKYMRERVGSGIVIDRELMDYLLISENARNRSLDVHVYRGTARGMSDHYLVEGKVGVAERWGPVRGAAVGQMCIKVKQVRKKDKMLEYQKIRSRWR